jgi:hypothetical protein
MPFPGAQLRWDNAEVDLETVSAPLTAGVARFTFAADGSMIDPDGNPFVPVGMNVNGSNWVWPEATLGESDKMALWGINTIRTNNYSRPNPPYPDFHNNDDIRAIVEEYTSQNYVVMVANHTYGASSGVYMQPGGSTSTETYFQDLINWWLPLASDLKDNPYVWFNLINEPTGGPAAYPAPDFGLDWWMTLQTRLADAISEVAPNSMIVFDGHNAGQEKSHPSTRNAPDFTIPPFAYTAALSRGPALQARYGRDRVILSAHMYGVWAAFDQPGTYPNAYGPNSDPWLYFRSDMNFYFDECARLGIPLIVGEFAARTNDPDDWYMAGSTTTAHVLLEQVLPGRTPLDVVQPGVLFWHGSGGGNQYLELTRSSWLDWAGSDSTLNWQGQAFVNYARSHVPVA